MRDLLRDVHIGRVQVDVVGDKELARAYDHGARRGMQRRFAEVGLARRIGPDFLANALELTSSNVLQVLPLGNLCSSLVQINGNLVPLPDFFADTTRNGNAIFQRRAFDGNERDHIRGSQPGVRARVLRKIDQLGGLAHAANRGLSHVNGIADQRDDTAVVVGIHLAVEQVNAIHLHSVDDGIDAPFVAPFGEVRHTFDQYRHKNQDKARWQNLAAIRFVIIEAIFLKWRYRLGVRTEDSQSSNPGSIPGSATKP